MCLAFELRCDISALRTYPVADPHKNIVLVVVVDMYLFRISTADIYSACRFSV